MAGPIQSCSQRYNGGHTRAVRGERSCPQTDHANILHENKIKPKRVMFVAGGSRSNDRTGNRGRHNPLSCRRPRLKGSDMPFDGKRMIYGGFTTLLQARDERAS
ncbi:hypothetical protein V1280_000322 [Bradyrhizobium sp. AZCC 2230]